MKKRSLVLLLVVVSSLILVFASNTVSAVLTDIRIELDGKFLALKDANGNMVQPVIINGTTYLPVRAISQNLGLKVEWDGDQRIVSLATEQYAKQNPSSTNAVELKEITKLEDLIERIFAMDYGQMLNTLGNQYETYHLSGGIQFAYNLNNLVLSIGYPSVELPHAEAKPSSVVIHGIASGHNYKGLTNSSSPKDFIKVLGTPIRIDNPKDENYEGDGESDLYKLWYIKENRTYAFGFGSEEDICYEITVYQGE